MHVLQFIGIIAIYLPMLLQNMCLHSYPYIYIYFIELTTCRQSVHTNVSPKEGLLTVKGATISSPSPTSL